MIAWQRIRLNLLILTGCSISIWLVKSLWFPPVTTQENNPKYQFPASVPLANWQLGQSQPLKVQTTSPPGLISSRLYEYTKPNLKLAIEMRYTVEKGGNLIEFIRDYTPELSPSLGSGWKQDSYQESTGFYTLFTSKGRAYLVSCINPRGGSTITAQQFNSNRYKYDLELPRLTNWLLGKGNIRDLRCLWTQLSIPLEKLPQKQAFSMLESAWVDWYKWWYPRFPKEY